MALLYKRLGIDLTATTGNDVRVKVTINDSSSGFLDDKISVSSSGKVTKTITSPSGNETLQLDVDETNIDHNILQNYEINQHRELDDALTTNSNLWSGSKIQSELDGKVNAIPNPVSDNKLLKSIGLDGVNVEQTSIDVDDSNNVTGVNNLTVDGDLTVNGTEFIANVETIDVEDPNIGLNRNGTQATANSQKAGLTVQMTDTTDAIVGYDSTTTSKFKVGEDGDEREILTTTHAQGMSNKTIDADLNTISNLRHGEEVDDPASDVHGVGVGNDVVGTGTAQTLTNKTIDADNNVISNLKHGTEVDDPASGVHGVTGNVVGTSDTQTLTNKTIDGTSATGTNTISLDAQNVTYDNSTSGLGATDAQGALDELDGRIDGIESGFVSSFNSRTGAVSPQASDYDATQVDYDNTTSGLTATETQSAIDEVDGNLDSHVAATSGVHGVTGDVVGTTDAQDLSNKAIIDPSRADVLKDTEANLTTYAATATDGQLAFSTDSKKYFGITDNVLASLGGFDIDESDSLSNNVMTPTNVVGFNVNGSKAFTSEIVVVIDADTDQFEKYTLEGVFVGTDWEITYSSVGESQVEFDMTTGGQLNYTSGNYAGFVSGTVDFKVTLI